MAVLLSLIPAAFLGGVYVLFGIAMPRSGGDYVFISRTLHPSIGLAANMSATAWNLIILGVYANWVATVGLSGMFASIGLSTGNHTLDQLGLEPQRAAVGRSASAPPCDHRDRRHIAFEPPRRAANPKSSCSTPACSAFWSRFAVVALTSHATFVKNLNHYSSYAGFIHAACAGRLRASHRRLAGSIKQTILSVWVPVPEHAVRDVRRLHRR